MIASIEPPLSSKNLKVQLVQCELCCQEVEAYRMAKICTCHHIFCELCLLQYIEGKLKAFQIIRCPYNECTGQLDEDSGLVVTFTEAEQIKYKKIKFRRKAEEQNHILCPHEDCEEGILQIKVKQNQRKIGRCKKCKTVYCLKCMLPKHKGECQQLQEKILGQKFNFKKCPNCNRMVERSQGCEHMICKCKCQFCYSCGQKWIGRHQCVIKREEVNMKEEVMEESQFSQPPNRISEQKKEEPPPSSSQPSTIPFQIKENLRKLSIFSILSKNFGTMTKLKKLGFICTAILYLLAFSITFICWIIVSLLYLILITIVLIFVFLGISIQEYFSKFTPLKVAMAIIFLPIFICFIFVRLFHMLIDDLLHPKNPTREVYLLFLTGNIKPYRFFLEDQLIEINLQKQKERLNELYNSKKQSIAKHEKQMQAKKQSQREKMFFMGSEAQFQAQKKQYEEFLRRQRRKIEREQRQCLALERKLREQEKQERIRKQQKKQDQLKRQKWKQDREKKVLQTQKKRQQKRTQKKKKQYFQEEVGEQTSTASNNQMKIQKKDIESLMSVIRNYETHREVFESPSMNKY